MVGRQGVAEDGRLSVRWSENATVDPVYLTVVQKDKIPHLAGHGREIYCFCSPECKREFAANPVKYKDLHISP